MADPSAHTAAAQPGQGGPRVAVLGATGYAGALAGALLWRHPAVELVALGAREEHPTLSALYPKHRVPLPLEPVTGEALAELDTAVALVAYPHGAAAPIVAELLSAGVRVVDLSADFRLTDLDTYEAWYGEHGAREVFGTGVYGLPELGRRDEIAAATLVANPGCYPTAALIALQPLARAGLVADVVIDAKSGISGAGRGATQTTHFVSAAENVNAYKVGAHRHTPEIEQELGNLGAALPVTFVPHLVPLDQGELASVYVTPARSVTATEVAALFDEAYAGEPWVEIASSPPGMRDVRDTNFCRLSTHVDERTGRIMVFSVIDNLWKGAASQAVQNLNLMLGIDEGTGL